MPTPETNFKNRVAKYLNKLGRSVWFFKVKGGPEQKAGVPDTVGCIEGKFFAFELKVPPNGPSPKQEYEVEKINAAGGKAAVIYDFEQFKEWFENV